jgi:ABC-type glycerol-3-phosphate transport system substrate-binding protein
MANRPTQVLVILLVLFSMIGLSVPVIAQDEIALSISLPDYLLGSVSLTRAFEEFEAQNPNIRVEVRSNGNRVFSPPSSATDIDRFLSETQHEMGSADVVSVDSSWLIPELTQSGYVLDIAPLINGDTQFDEDVFMPAAWQSFQWDTGIWALPITLRPVVLLYHESNFDDAQYPYPSESWGITELADAARALATYDADGNVTAPGILIWDNSALMILIRSLLEDGVYDESVMPSVPDFSDAALLEILSILRELSDEGVMLVRDFMSNVSDAPMMIADSFFTMQEENPFSVSLFPNGHAGAKINGLAISRGTLYPEAAYQLVRFLTSNAEFVSTNGGVPAVEGLPTFMPPLDLDLSNTFPASELRFTNYLLSLITVSGVDVETTLETLQIEVTTNLADVYAARDTVEIDIPAPRPEQVLQEGEIALEFGVLTSISPMPTQGQWTNVARDFAEEDAEVAVVNVEPMMGGVMSGDVMEMYDCFYTPSNITHDVDLSLLTSIDPLLASDPNFDADDIVGSVLQQLTREDQIWGMPLTIEPEVMWIDRERFDAAGLPIPQGTWTINDFTVAMSAFEDSEDGTIITSYHFPPSDVYLLMLIAAYGGLPIDYRTTPPTLNFSDPATVAAIRQVLDIARAGRMNYQSLVEMPMSSNSGTTAFILAPLDDSNSRQGDLVRMGGSGGDYQLMAYPSGTDYTPLAYNVGAAYISANSQNPEACYRFISYVAQHPELFTGMPARRSQINSAEVLASRGEEAVAFYNSIDQTMQSLNVVEFSGYSSYLFSLEGYRRRWLDLAFDRYVLEDADLETELADAQAQTELFLACVDALPTNDDYDMGVYDCMNGIYSAS